MRLEAAEGGARVLGGAAKAAVLHTLRASGNGLGRAGAAALCGRAPCPYRGAAQARRRQEWLRPFGRRGARGRDARARVACQPERRAQCARGARGRGAARLAVAASQDLERLDLRGNGMGAAGAQACSARRSRLIETCCTSTCRITASPCFPFTRSFGSPSPPPVEKEEVGGEAPLPPPHRPMGNAA